MQKYAAFLAAAVLMLCCCSANAVSVWGYDSDDSGHVWTENLYFHRVSQDTGLTFELEQFTSREAWTSAKAMMEADDALPEVLFKADLTTSETLALQKKGVLLDLSPLIDSCMPNLSALLNEHPEWRAAITMPDGTIPALPYINQLHNYNAMWINQEWLNKVGLPVPNTREELVEVLRAFRDKDPNGDGRQNEVPLAFLGMWDLRFLSHAFGFIIDDYGLCMDSEGNVKAMMTQDINRDFLAWLHELWAEKLLDPAGFTTADAYRRITDAKATINYGIVMGPTPLHILPSNVLDSYVLLPPLMNESGTRIYRDFIGDVTRGTFALTVACKEPAPVLAWIDSLYTEAGMMLAFAGKENEDYEFHSDGTYSWYVSEEEMYSNGLHDQITIVDGTPIPGLMTAAVQERYDSAATRKLVQSIASLSEYGVMSMPPILLTEETLAEISGIQNVLGEACAQRTTWFVTGEIELNDENWQAFCSDMEALGLGRLQEIFQSLTQSQHSPLQ